MEIYVLIFACSHGLRFLSKLGPSVKFQVDRGSCLLAVGSNVHGNVQDWTVYLRFIAKKGNFNIVFEKLSDFPDLTATE